MLATNAGTSQNSRTSGWEGGTGRMCVCAVYVHVCVRENRNDGAGVHQQPNFIFIVYNYLVIPGGGRGKQNQQDYLSAYTESKL